MLSFFYWIWNTIYFVIGLILPVFASAKDVRRLSAPVRWFIHLLFLALILVGLYFLNSWLHVEYALRGPAQVREIWLPLLYVLVYLLSWVGWWVWLLFGAEAEGYSDFPDIEKAWDEGVRAAAKQGIDITALPVFLVLGRPASGMASLFQAAQMSVKRGPADPDAPVHLYFNREAVYVTCSGASILGRQAELFAEVERGADEGGAQEDEAVSIGMASASFGQYRTMAGTMMATDTKRGRETKARRELLKAQSDIDRQAARLRAVCRLLARDRRPYCPINGILLLISFGATDTDEAANHVAMLCQRELAVVRDNLQVRCPSVALVCDLEEADGFMEFQSRLGDKERQQRVGHRFPLLPDIDPKGQGEMYEGGVRWVCASMFPKLIYKLFRLEKPGQTDLSQIINANARLYKFLSELSMRQKRMTRIVNRVPFSDGAPMLSGMYIAATGPVPAFVAGVFRRLVENQDYVSWTDNALQADRRFHARARFGYFVMILLVLGALGAGYYFTFLYQPQ